MALARGATARPTVPRNEVSVSLVCGGRSRIFGMRSLGIVTTCGFSNFLYCYLIFKIRGSGFISFLSRQEDLTSIVAL